ncbi:flagellar filament capping protein FliD [Rhizobacter fulvus]|jgi:flagellar hook-associated protein 2
MAVSSPGIGSGLDVNSIVTQLVAIERQPITTLKKQATDVQSQLSVYGQLQSKLSALQSASAALSQSTTWTQTAGTSSDPASVGVATDSTTRAGSYQVQVTSLASGQSVATASSYASADAVIGEGTLHVQLGSWAGGGFAAKAGAAAVDITIGPGAQTLAQVRDAINNANAGVTASVLTDSTGTRLVLRSSATGEVNGFQIGVTDTGGGGLSALAYDPGGTSAMTLARPAADAIATIDNLPVRSASNTLSGVIDGVTLTLSKVTTAPVQIVAANDADAIKTKITAFVTAYNDVNSMLAAQTKYDAATKTAGALQGDSAAWGLRTQLRNMLGTTSGASSMFGRLSDIGFDVKSDGSISVNDTKLTNGLANLDQLRKVFANSDPVTPANDGVVLQMRKLTDRMLAFDGTLQSRTDGLQHRLDLNQTQQSKLEDRVTRTEARLRAQYSALDTQMNTLNGLSSYVQQQITNWNKSTA